MKDEDGGNKNFAMTRTAKLSITLLGLLVAFPFMYPLSRQFFRGSSLAGPPKSGSQNRVAADDVTTADSAEKQDAVNQDADLAAPIFGPDLVIPSATDTPADVDTAWQLLAHAPGATRQAFRLLSGVRGRSSVHPSEPVLFSPRSGDLQIWDLQERSLRDKRRIDALDNNTIFTGAICSPNGEYIAMCSPYGPMRLLRYPDLSLVTLPTDRSISADRIAFHPDGQRFAAVGQRTPQGGSIHNAFWIDLISGSCNELVPENVTVVDTAVDDAGQTIAIVSTEAILVFDVATLDQVQEFPVSVEPTCLVPSADGDWIVGMADGSVRKWSSRTGQWKEDVQLATGPRRVIDLVRLDDKERFCVLTGEEKVLVWNSVNGSTQVLGAHQTAHQIHAIPDGGDIVTAGFRNGSRIWPLPDTKASSIASTEPELNWSLVAISADGSTVAAVGEQVHVWQVNDGKCIATFRPRTNWIKDVCLSPDGALLAIVGAGLVPEVWSVNEKQLTGGFVDPNAESRWPRNIDRLSRCIRFNDKGTELIVAQQDAIRIFDIPTRERLAELARVVPQSGNVLISMIQAIDIDHHFGRIATAQSDRILVWDRDNEQTLDSLDTRGSIDPEHPGIFFSADGKRIAVGHLYRISVYEIESGRQIDQLPSHWVHGSDENGWIVSNRDGMVSVWSAAEQDVPPYERKRGQPQLTPLMKFTGQLQDLAMSDDGKIVLIDQRNKPLVYSK